MNKQEQRIAIAEACGWIPHPDNDTLDVKCWTLGGSIYGEKGSKIARSKIINDDTWGIGQNLLPDYLNDLNAMHEAEKVLDDSYEAKPPRQCVSYAKLLQRIGATTNGGKSDFGIANSTASQRAEAFLKTLNLWT